MARSLLLSLARYSYPAKRPLLAAAISAIVGPKNETYYTNTMYLIINKIKNYSTFGLYSLFYGLYSHIRIHCVLFGAYTHTMYNMRRCGGLS